MIVYALKYERFGNKNLYSLMYYLHVLKYNSVHTFFIIYILNFTKIEVNTALHFKSSNPLFQIKTDHIYILKFQNIYLTIHT